MSSGAVLRGLSLCSLQGPCLFIPNSSWELGTGAWGCLCTVTTGAEHGEGSPPQRRLYLSINIVHPIPQGRGGAKKPTPGTPLLLLPWEGSPQNTLLLPTGRLSLPAPPRPELFPQQAGLCSVNSSPLARQPSRSTGVLPYYTCVGVGEEEGGRPAGRKDPL